MNETMTINGTVLSPQHRKLLREAVLFERACAQTDVNLATNDVSGNDARADIQRCSELLAAIDKEATECTATTAAD